MEKAKKLRLLSLNIMTPLYFWYEKGFATVAKNLLFCHQRIVAIQ